MNNNTNYISESVLNEFFEESDQECVRRMIKQTTRHSQFCLLEKGQKIKLQFLPVQ